MNWYCFIFFIYATICQRCPKLFGEFECPIGHNCIDNQCLSPDGRSAPIECDKIQCPTMTRCYKGRCYSTIGLFCNRNVQINKTTAKSVLSNCGQFGKCINGHCILDRCANISCETTEQCRDGICVKIAGTFCLSSFDCGPNYDCIRNTCIKNHRVSCNCDPGESCQQGHCFADPKCAHVTCTNGSFCFDGSCVSAIGRDCLQETCLGGTVCINGRCSLDPCISRCPVDHDCREGHCRHLQGLPCVNECPYPYECVDGRCTRNECFQKLCLPGEICDYGFCVNVEGRLCSLAIRDCGQDFECESSFCKDKILLQGQNEK